MPPSIRPVISADLPALKTVIDSSELFPSELLDDMLSDYFQNPDSTDTWLTCTVDDQPQAVAYCAPERMTEGTWNLYLIAVHKSQQGGGIGASMMRHVEDLLRGRGVRVLIVETSGLPEFALTRKFYDKIGYHREAVIRDFYQEGDDKVVFWKRLDG